MTATTTTATTNATTATINTTTAAGASAVYLPP